MVRPTPGEAAINAVSSDEAARAVIALAIGKPAGMEPERAARLVADPRIRAGGIPAGGGRPARRIGSPVPRDNHRGIPS